MNLIQLRQFVTYSIIAQSSVGNFKMKLILSINGLWFSTGLTKGIHVMVFD